jgi:hypothetical protein
MQLSRDSLKNIFPRLTYSELNICCYVSREWNKIGTDSEIKSLAVLNTGAKNEKWKSFLFENNGEIKRENTDKIKNLLKRWFDRIIDHCETSSDYSSVDMFTVDRVYDIRNPTSLHGIFVIDRKGMELLTTLFKINYKINCTIINICNIDAATNSLSESLPLGGVYNVKFFDLTLCPEVKDVIDTKEIFAQVEEENKAGRIALKNHKALSELERVFSPGLNILAKKTDQIFIRFNEIFFEDGASEEEMIFTGAPINEFCYYRHSWCSLDEGENTELTIGITKIKDGKKVGYRQTMKIIPS